MEQREVDNMLLSMIQKHFPSLPLSDEHTDWGKWLGFARAVYEAGRASPASVPEGMELSAPTILPDGSGFGILSLPLPKDHWLYAEREYEEDAVEPKDLPAPILTHALRQQVIDAIRYAVRSATNCGKEDDFDPDALVQNAVYALCGPYGAAAPTLPVSEDRRDAERYRWLREQHWSESKLCVVLEPRISVRLGSSCPSLTLLDQAIDQSMQEDKS